MGYDKSDRNHVSFKDLKEFLKNNDLESAYLAGEYLLRGFLKQFDPATEFPHETIDQKDMSDKKMIETWEKFNKEHYPVQWGFHPLVPSGISEEIDPESISSAINSLLEKIPSESRFQEVIVYRKKIVKALETASKNIEKIKGILEGSDFWKFQQEIYLISSQIICKELFELEPRKLNELIHLKKKCYFPDELSVLNDTLRQRLNRVPDRDILKKEMLKYLEKHNARELIWSFQRYRDVS